MTCMFQGRLNKSNGYYYEGGFSNGQRNGQGITIYPNGDCFEGNWCNDVREGKGKYWIKQKNCYNSYKTDENSKRLITGVWKNDVMKCGVVNQQIKFDESTNSNVTDSCIC